MEYFCISASHHTAALDVRERLSRTPEEIQAALAAFAGGERRLGPDSEIAILSTCNRFEIYAAFRDEGHSDPGGPEAVLRALLAYAADLTGGSGPAFAGLFARYQGLDAVEHLFRVAAGLESQVLGEAQILGQVANALAAAQQAGAARHTLASLFRAALHAAKRAQSETEIGRNPASISSAAAGLAAGRLGDLGERRILVIGAGEMGRLAVRAFAQRGARDVTILNRTLARGAGLADRYGYRARPLAELPVALETADAVISAAGAQQPLLSAGLWREVSQRRAGRPALLIDIAVPRNIDPALRGMPGVALFDLDDLKDRLEQTLRARRAAAYQAEAILHEEIADFAHWMEIIPVVGRLHRQAERIRRQEVERTLRHLPNLDPDVQAQVEVLTRSLVRKLLHEPTMKARTELRDGRVEMVTQALNFLFNLEEDDERSEALAGGDHGRAHL